MEIHDFYNLGSKLSDSNIRVSAIELDKIPDPSATRFFDHDRLAVGDYGYLHFPIIFKEIEGKKWTDLLDTGWGSLYLISDRMKILLEENQLTGWKNYPIKLLDKKGNQVSGYHGFSIIGRCGPVDYSKSTIIQKRLYDDGPLKNYYRGYFIGLDKWDSSDFFIPEGKLRIIVTAKTAEILKKKKISNVALKNLADMEIEESNVI